MTPGGGGCWSGSTGGDSEQLFSDHHFRNLCIAKNNRALKMAVSDQCSSLFDELLQLCRFRRSLELGTNDSIRSHHVRTLRCDWLIGAFSVVKQRE